MSSDQFDPTQLVYVRVTFTDGTTGRSARMNRIEAERHLNSVSWLLFKTPRFTRSKKHVDRVIIVPWSEA